MSSRTGVLLIQLGTPDSPSVPDVRRYLFEFLNDPRVIDIPWLARKILVNFIIVPFRAPKSAKIYKELWSDKGSPLLFYSESVREKLDEKLGEDVDVYLAMRYQNPGMDKVLEEIRMKSYKKLIIFPLFPQYASSSAGSAIDKAMKIISKWWVIPEIKIVSHFFQDEGYLNTILERAKKYNINDYDHVLFSFHGLPERQVDKVHVDGKPCSAHNCKEEINEENFYCYKAECYATTRLIAS